MTPPDRLPPRPRTEPTRPTVREWVWFVVSLLTLAGVLFLIVALCIGGS